MAMESVLCVPKGICLPVLANRTTDGEGSVDSTLAVSTDEIARGEPPKIPSECVPFCTRLARSTRRVLPSTVRDHTNRTVHQLE